MPFLSRHGSAWSLGTLLILACLLTGCTGISRSSVNTSTLAALEQTHGGRLGVFALDTGTGRSLSWRADERFGMCSTFKLPLAAAVLRATASGEIDGDAPISFDHDDLVPHAPVLEARLAAGEPAMSAIELARATHLTSDNAAANLLIQKLGGTDGVTARWRAMGDTVTRLDRLEPAMNRVTHGDPRDSTTPQAMAHLVARLLTTDLLTAVDRDRLAGWMMETSTGQQRLRATVPPDWRAGDKTGSAIMPGMPNKTHDVAVFWPPNRGPVVVAAYYEADDHHPGPIRPQDEAVLAEVGRIVVAWASR